MIHEFENKVKQIIMNNNESITSIESIDSSDELNKYGINSISFIKILVDLETEFNIEFDDDELDYELFKSIKNICEAIEKKLSKK